MLSVKDNLAYLDVRPYICGGTAAVVAEICTFPLDTAKIRLQVQGSAAHSTAYSGTADCLHTIARQEGVAQLYRGLAPAVLRQAVYGTIKFGLYYSVKDVVMWRCGLQQESPAVNVFCGIVAGEWNNLIAAFRHNHCPMTAFIHNLCTVAACRHNLWTVAVCRHCAMTALRHNLCPVAAFRYNLCIVAA